MVELMDAHFRRLPRAETKQIIDYRKFNEEEVNY